MDKMDYPLKIYLDETLCGEMDDDSEFISSDAIFSDTSRKNGMANFIDKDFKAPCDLYAKSPNGINNNSKTSNLSGWEASTMSNLKTDTRACSGWANNNIGNKNRTSQLTTATGWDTNSPERECDCTGGWTKDAIYSESREDAWKSHDQKNALDVNLQACNVPNGSGWETQVETSGGINNTDRQRSDADSNVSKNEDRKNAAVMKKRAAGTNQTSNFSAWQSNNYDRSTKDCTHWNNPCSEMIQEDNTKLHGNQLNPNQNFRYQACGTPQQVYSKKKILEVNDNVQCWSEKVIALQASRDPDFPPGFSSVKGSYKEDTVSLQRIDSETNFSSSTDILKTSPWKDSADEQGQHELCSCDIKSDNTLKSKLTSSNLIIGKGSPGGIQWEALNKITSQDVEQGQRTSEEDQATGWSVEWQADVSETSWTIAEVRFKEAQDTKRRMDQIISEETQSTRWNVDQHAEVTKTSWTTPETKVEGPGEPRSFDKNMFEQEQEDHDEATELSRAGNLASPVWTKLLEGENDECKLSSSFTRREFKPTGANLGLIGSRSHKRAKSKSCEKSLVGEYAQDQATSLEMQQNWGLKCNVKEDGCKSPMAWEHDGRCKKSENNAQNKLLLDENSNVIEDLHTPKRRYGEDVPVNSWSNLETEKNDVLAEDKAARPSLESFGWGLENQNDSTPSAWELPSQSDPSPIAGWQLPSQGDPSSISSWELPNESEPATISNWELQSCSEYRQNKKMCFMKSMEDVRPTNDKSAISSLRSTKRDWVHLTSKNGRASGSRKTESPTGLIDRPSELHNMLNEINPIMHLMRMILHHGSYSSGDRLRPEHEKEVLERVLIHHPASEAKIGCGVDFILVDNHAEFSSTRCFYIVRKDGTRTDFSYLKCLKGLAEKKYPDSAKYFIEKYIKRK